MRPAAIIACFLTFFIPHALPSQELSSGYDHFYNLEYDQAIAEFTAETEQHPHDPNAWNHLAHAVLYRAMYRSGALESELVTGSNPFLRRAKVEITPTDQSCFDDAIEKAMALSQARLKENPDDPRSLGALGVAYALRGNYNFLVRKAWVDALHDATDGKKMHQRLAELEPDNIDALMIPGVYDYVAGSLPLGYRIFGFLAGYHGDRARGIRTLQTVAQEAKSNRADAEILLAAIYRRERRTQDAVPLLDDLIRRFPRNHLLRFELVQMYSDMGDKEKAAAEIAQVWDLHKNGAPGFASLQPERIDYLEGNFLFWYNDLKAAADHLTKVTAKARDLDLNTAIMAWMRLGQTYDLQGRRSAATSAYRKAIALAPKSEVGKESRGYIAKPYRRRTGTRIQEPESSSQNAGAAFPTTHHPPPTTREANA
jgi:cytochrome c-type biogenesis protein CcmH/NrfG